MKIKYLIFCLFILITACGINAFADTDTIKISEKPSVAGELFGKQVSMDNYYFAKAAALIFKGRWGVELETPQEIEDRVWEDLILSYEAYRRNIVVSQEVLEKEISDILLSEKVTFDWKKDKTAYSAWIKEKIHESTEAFENQLKHLLGLQKLRDEVRMAAQPAVTKEEAYQKYLNEYNSLSVEFVQFDDLKSANAYYEKMKNPKKWQQEAKKNPKFSVKPGFVSLEFLIEMWKFAKDDAYAMLKLPIGSVYKPAPIYKGYAVFHTLDKRVAEKDKFDAQQLSYFDKVKAKKQHEGLSAWLKQLKEDAHLKVYINPTKQP